MKVKQSINLKLKVMYYLVMHFGVKNVFTKKELCDTFLEEENESEYIGTFNSLSEIVNL